MVVTLRVDGLERWAAVGYATKVDGHVYLEDITQEEKYRKIFKEPCLQLPEPSHGITHVSTTVYDGFKIITIEIDFKIYGTEVDPTWAVGPDWDVWHHGPNAAGLYATIPKEVGRVINLWENGQTRPSLAPTTQSEATNVAIVTVETLQSHWRCLIALGHNSTTSTGLFVYDLTDFVHPGGDYFQASHCNRIFCTWADDHLQHRMAATNEHQMKDELTAAGANYLGVLTSKTNYCEKVLPALIEVASSEKETDWTEHIILYIVGALLLVNFLLCACQFRKQKEITQENVKFDFAQGGAEKTAKSDHDVELEMNSTQKTEEVGGKKSGAGVTDVKINGMGNL